MPLICGVQKRVGKGGEGWAGLTVSSDYEKNKESEQNWVFVLKVYSS